MIKMSGNLANQRTKAIAEHCKVRIIRFKEYEVASGHGTAYTVTFKLLHDGWYGVCHCRAAANFHACYHLVAGFTVLLAHCRQRDEAARKRSESRRDHRTVIYSDGRTCCATWAAKGRACPLSKAGKEIFSTMAAQAA